MAGRAEITSAEGRGITGNLPNDFDNSNRGKHMARPYGGRPTCEGCMSIDVRHLHREGASLIRCQ